jgi:hypothetical protein
LTAPARRPFAPFARSRAVTSLIAALAIAGAARAQTRAKDGGGAWRDPAPVASTLKRIEPMKPRDASVRF